MTCPAHNKSSQCWSCHRTPFGWRRDSQRVLQFRWPHIRSRQVDWTKNVISNNDNNDIIINEKNKTDMQLTAIFRIRVYSEFGMTYELKNH